VDTIWTFVWGVGGSLAVEIVYLHQYLQTEPYHIPERYRKVSFWIVRLALAGIAGGLAVAYAIEDPILALNVGAATPLIIGAFAKGVPAKLSDLPTPATPGSKSRHEEG
jgi:hypothetical protein